MSLQTFRILCGMVFLFTVGLAMTESGPLQSVKAASFKPTEDEFDTFIRIFKLEAEYRRVHTKIDRVRIKMIDRKELSMKNAVGVCHTDTGFIEILKPYWDQANFTQREILIMHELGHCALDLDHDNSEGFFGPNSIMRSEVLNPSYYNNFRKNLVDEMFNKRK
jgi:hypothetical protein